MPKKFVKRPSYEKFVEVSDACRGVISRIAEVFQVDRSTIYDWCGKDPRLQAVIDNTKGKLLDECLRSARLLAIGIPKDPQHLDKGWKERPDGNMLRYLISTLGRREGYGEAIDITSKGESVKPEPMVIEVIDRRDQIVKPHEE